MKKTPGSRPQAPGAAAARPKLQAPGQRSDRPVVFFDLDETLTTTRLVASKAAELERVKQLAARRVATLPYPEKIAAMYRRRIAWIEASTRVVLGDECYLAVARPGIERELASLARSVDLAVLTAATLDYAEAVIEALGLGKFFGAVVSIREKNDLSWARGRLWVLVDDLQPGTASTQEKLRQIIGLTENAWEKLSNDKRAALEARVLNVSPFLDDLPDPNPIVGIARKVKKKLSAISRQPSANKVTFKQSRGSRSPPHDCLDSVGRTVRAWTHSSASLAILDASPLHGSHWGEGGCLVLAKALVQILPDAKLYGVYWRGRLQHAVVAWGGGYLDYRGAVKRGETLLRRMEREYGRAGAVLLPGARATRSVTAPAAVVRATEEALRERLQAQAPSEDPRQPLRSGREVTAPKAPAGAKLQDSR